MNAAPVLPFLSFAPPFIGGFFMLADLLREVTKEVTGYMPIYPVRRARTHVKAHNYRKRIRVTRRGDDGAVRASTAVLGDAEFLLFSMLTKSTKCYIL